MCFKDLLFPWDTICCPPPPPIEVLILMVTVIVGYQLHVKYKSRVKLGRKKYGWWMWEGVISAV